MRNFKSKTPTSNCGFTLIELLVVITIMAILSAIGFSTFQGFQSKGRDTKRTSDIDTIVKALEAHYDPNNYATAYGPISSSWFTDGKVPVDPVGTSTCGMAHASSCTYCMRSSKGEFTTCASVVQDGLPNSGLPKMTICANLENSLKGDYFYCRDTSQ